MRPLVKKWHSMGDLSFIYLDDGFCGQPDKVSAAVASFIQSKELSASGLLCNGEQVWGMVSVCYFKSNQINMVAMKFFCQKRKYPS